MLKEKKFEKLYLNVTNLLTVDSPWQRIPNARSSCWRSNDSQFLYYVTRLFVTVLRPLIITLMRFTWTDTHRWLYYDHLSFTLICQNDNKTAFFSDNESYETAYFFGCFQFLIIICSIFSLFIILIFGHSKYLTKWLPKIALKNEKDARSVAKWFWYIFFSLLLLNDYVIKINNNLHDRTIILFFDSFIVGFFFLFQLICKHVSSYSVLLNMEICNQ